MLELKIDNRPILPVRLIPFVTGWKFSPNVVAGLLSQTNDTYRITFNSYHVDNDGSHHLMRPKEWDTVCSNLDARKQKKSDIGQINNIISGSNDTSGKKLTSNENER